MSYIGRTPVYGALEAQIFTGNGTTTSFVLNYAVSTSASLLVTVDGVFKVPSIEFGAQGNYLNFADAPANSARICVVFLGRELLVPTTAGRTIQVDSYVGDNTTVTFALTEIPVIATALFVFVDGILKKLTTDYSISGQNVVFVSAPNTGAKIELFNMGAEKLLDVGSLEDGALLLSKIEDPIAATLGRWQIIAGNFTAAQGSWYMVDTSGGVVSMTLPVAATLGDTIRFMDVAGAFNTNNLTIVQNGHKIQGVSQNMTIDSQGAANALVYSNATHGWRLLDL
jgi:hypothetical protein